MAIVNNLVESSPKSGELCGVPQSPDSIPNASPAVAVPKPRGGLSTTHPQRPVVQSKPPKPYRTFPLFAHAKGYWAKKIDGKQVSFGKWANPDPGGASWKAALDRYKTFDERRARGLHTANRPEDTTVGEVVDQHLTWQLGRFNRGEIGRRSFADLRTTLTAFRDAVGRDVTIGELEHSAAPILKWRDATANALGWHAFNRAMILVAGLWRWTTDRTRGGPLGRPTDLVRMFPKRPAKVLRKAARLRDAATGKPIFEPAELRALIDHASPLLRAGILLGYFGAFGQSDIAELPASAVTIDPPGYPGWASIDFPRPKTEIDRQLLLPPIAVKALQAVAVDAVELPVKFPGSSTGPLLRSTDGKPLVFLRDVFDDAGLLKRVVVADRLGEAFRRLRESLGCCATHGWQRRPADEPDTCPHPGCARPLAKMRCTGFYSLRRGAITAAVGAADPDVLHRWRGHALAGMSQTYVRRIDPAELAKITTQLGRVAGIDLNG